MQHASLCFSYKSTDFPLGFLLTASPVQSLSQKSLHNSFLSISELSPLFLICNTISFREEGGEKERRNQISKKGGNKRREETESERKVCLSIILSTSHREVPSFRNNSRMALLIIRGLRSINCWVILTAQ